MDRERRPPDHTRQPGSPTDPISRGPRLTSRLRGPSLSLRAAIALIAAVGLVFLLGYLAGRGGEPRPAATTPPAEAEEPRGGRGACNRALDIANEMLELQRQALANRTEFTEAALAVDEARMTALNDELEPISGQIQEAQTRLNRALTKCQQRRGERGGGGNDGG